MLTIDGQNGGGQILRTSLSLSILTGQPFRMVNIRAKRSKLGLMRQHLTCVRAAQEISSGSTDGAELHSTELVFHPGDIQSGDYVFKIGTAGSTSLLFQTLLPALASATDTSTLELHGGTHNPMAPSTHFLKACYLPLLRNMGFRVDFDLETFGFAPAGGGCIRTTIQPLAPDPGVRPINLTNRGKLLSQHVTSYIANVRESVAQSELETAQSRLQWPDESLQIQTITACDGSGNCLIYELEFATHIAQFTSFGTHGKPAKRVASEGAKQLLNFLNTNAAIEPKLADQLLLPMALSKQGSLKTINVTNHIKTNIATIEAFLGIRFHIENQTNGETLITIG